MAGKGSKPRPINKTKYNENWDGIDWSKKESQPQKEVTSETPKE